MNSLTTFIVSMVVLLVGWLLWSFRGKSFDEVKDYFSSKEGKKISKGILLALAFSVVVALTSLIGGCAGSYGNWGSVYAGIDYPDEQSPQCESSGQDDKSTSNLGFKLNIFESDDDRFTSNLKYTHHSCAFNQDRNGYDAFGLELEFKPWMR